MEQPPPAPLAMPAPRWLGPAECCELLGRHGVVLPAQAFVTSPDAAAGAARRIGLPVALKAVAAGLLHKSEVGGVRLGLASADAVAEAARAMAAAIPELRGFVVQAMAPPGVELIVGLKRDPVFGPVVVVARSHLPPVLARAGHAPPSPAPSAADRRGGLKVCRPVW